MKQCRHCGIEFYLFKGKPGYVDECLDCSTDVPKYVAEEGSYDDGSVESMTTNPITISYLKDLAVRQL